MENGKRKKGVNEFTDARALFIVAFVCCLLLLFTKGSVAWVFRCISDLEFLFEPNFKFLVECIYLLNWSPIIAF